MNNTLPELLKLPEEIIRKALDQHSFDLRVALPGIIVSWNPTAQTAQIQLTIKERINSDGIIEHVQLPILPDVPLATIKGGGHLIVTAINQGDECWVWFADACHDATWQSGGIQNQAEKRRHDLSDGFFIPSLFSQPNKISNYPTAGIQLRDVSGVTKVEVISGTVNIAGSNVNITGSNIVLGSNTKIDGRVFLNHTHSGVTSGPASTGPVV